VDAWLSLIIIKLIPNQNYEISSADTINLAKYVFAFAGCGLVGTEPLKDFIVEIKTIYVSAKGNNFC